MHKGSASTRSDGRARRAIAIAAAAAALGVFVTRPVSAAPAGMLAEATGEKPGTRIYILPGDEVFAEGVAVHGDEYFVTGFVSGKVYRGDLDERKAEVFIPDAGFGASGIKVVGRHLVVAGGYGGNVSVYDRTTGALVARWSDVPCEFSNVNDVAIAPNGDAYITDSDCPVLYRIPSAEVRHPSAAAQDLPIFLEWAGTPFTHHEGSTNANGIVATPDGKYVLVVNFTDGKLFRVRLSDKQVREIGLGGYRLTGGDGMVLTGDNVLYVVRIFDSLVAKIHLNARYERGRLLSETTDPTFHGPTTAAIAGNRLLVANSQFTGPPSAPPWTVSSIPVP